MKFRWLCLYLMPLSMSTGAAVNRQKVLCRNPKGDIGTCTTQESCASSKGIYIGRCPDPIEETCCYMLPCSKMPIDQLGNKPNKRRKRSIITVLPESSNCGFRGDRATASVTTSQLIQPLSRGAQRQEQLINGFNVDSSKALFPWMLALWIKEFPITVPSCGAALISDRHAITAAHCVNNNRIRYVLRGGSVINELPTAEEQDLWIHGKFNLGGVIIEISKIIVHPSYDTFTYENDIALIVLVDRIRPSRELYPVCLPAPAKTEVTDYSGIDVSVTGWGCTSEQCGVGETPRLLQEVVIEVIPNDLAMCWFLNDSDKPGSFEYIPKKLFMVGGDESGHNSTCHGDSGSPVVRPIPGRWGQYEVVGLVSWSKGCGRAFRPSVWTRVETFVDWLTEQMQSS